MKNYIVYETTTGYIQRVGICPDDNFSGQAGTGESVFEGTALDDGSEMIDIEADPLVVIANPDYVAPDSPVYADSFTQVGVRLERLENPYPATLTITFSGITNNSSTDDPLVTGVATDFNGSFELTLDTPGGTSYSYSSGEKRINVEIGRNVSNAIEAYLFGATDNGVVFHHGGDTFRGGTYDNDGAGTPVYNSAGENGTCFIA